MNSKSGFDFSQAVLNNAQRMGKEPVRVEIAKLIYTKSNFDETLLKKYISMDTCPPPIVVIPYGENEYKIVDGHHRVESQKRK